MSLDELGLLLPSVLQSSFLAAIAPGVSSGPTKQPNNAPDLDSIDEPVPGALEDGEKVVRGWAAKARTGTIEGE